MNIEKIKTVIGVGVSLISLYFFYLMALWLPTTGGTNPTREFYMNILGPFLLLLSGLLWISSIRKNIPFFKQFNDGSQVIISVLLLIVGFLFMFAMSPLSGI